jgi:chloramphenicol-sensitive protein RarD
LSREASGPAGAGQALAAGVVCYLLWAIMPIVFLVMAHAGATPWEILGQRALWSAPWAAALALIAGQGREVVSILRRPPVFAALALSAALIAVNWAVYVWAVVNRHNLDASLGYYINPLLNVAVGALFFRERIDPIARAAVALAAAGVLLQAIAVGRPPVLSLALAVSFCSYGVIRKRVDASAQAGLLIECLLMFLPGLAYVGWLVAHGQGLFGHGLANSALMSSAGPLTVFPLALFAWSARRLPFASIGFLQFIGPSIGFLIGVAVGEPLSPLRIASFGFIWAAAALFVLGAWRAGRRIDAAGGAVQQGAAY